VPPLICATGSFDVAEQLGSTCRKIVIVRISANLPRPRDLHKMKSIVLRYFGSPIRRWGSSKSWAGEMEQHEPGEVCDAMST
jgi:hypothetical protein